MVMLPVRWTEPVTLKNWKIALQLKLRNFCMRPARRIIDTGRASYVWAERARALIMVEFSEGKFFLCRELFLTKSSVNRTECSIPFCDRGVFRMFISSTASCTYKKAYFIKKLFLQWLICGNSFLVCFYHACQPGKPCKRMLWGTDQVSFCIMFCINMLMWNAAAGCVKDLCPILFL